MSDCIKSKDVVLWILDKNFATVQNIPDAITLKWERRWESSGIFSFEVPLAYNTVLDNINDPTQPRFVWRPGEKYIGRIDRCEVEGNTIYATGTFLEGYLEYRVCSHRDRGNPYQGTVEDVVRQIVADNCINNRPIPKLTLGPHSGQAIQPQVVVDCYGKTVYNAIYELAEQHKCSFNISLDPTGGVLQFVVLWGKDRTQNQSVNEWCVFAESQLNLIRAKFEANSLYINTCVGKGRLTETYVSVGTGPFGGDEKSYTVYDYTSNQSIILEGEDVRETFVDLMVGGYELTSEDSYEVNNTKRQQEQQKFQENLDTATKNAVLSHPKIQNIQAQVQILNWMVFGLGDVVDVEYPSYNKLLSSNIVYDKCNAPKKVFPLRIASLTDAYSNNEYRTSIDFGQKV